ncbi:hypothetical protein ABZ837_14805 [Streptomyces sp. NPDC047197]|uniref:hypothetical protein n=1 Tax=Streptomyces sp. NPDC047197 TaxID=3155477 RepID=UPI0033D583FE
MSASRTYLLDPLYETETLKLPPSRTDLAVIGAGVALSVTHGVAVPGILGTLTCIVPAALAGALSLVKSGGSTVVERVARRGGHTLRKRALDKAVRQYESEPAPSASDAEGALPHHDAFTRINDLIWHERDGYAFPQGSGRLLAAFEWVTDGAALKGGAHRDRAHDALAAFLEWVAATGHGSCVRIVHAVSPYAGEQDIRAEKDGDLADSYRQLMELVNGACDVHTTVILLSVPARGTDVEEETAWAQAAFEQAQVCGIDTGQMWDRTAWDTALSTIRGEDLYEIHEDHFRSGDYVTATAEVADFRRGERAAEFWRPMITTLPRVTRTTVVEYLPLDRRKAEKRLETGEMLRTATARDEKDVRREKTSTRTGRRAAELHEEDISDGAAYVKVAARIMLQARDQTELKEFRRDLEQNAVSAGAHLTWMDKEHETGWHSALPLPGGEITC